MLTRFSPEVRALVMGARDQARRIGHNYVGCEHILLALAASGDGVGERLRGMGVTPVAVEREVRRLVGVPKDFLDREALASIGIDVDEVKRKLEDVFGPGALSRAGTCSQRDQGHLPFTPRAKKCLELSLREARSVGGGPINPEDLALALFSMVALDKSLVAQIVEAIGAAPSEVAMRLRYAYRKAS